VTGVVDACASTNRERREYDDHQLKGNQPCFAADMAITHLLIAVAEGAG
jgi:hypothetical protein